MDSYFDSSSFSKTTEGIDPIHSVFYAQFHPLEGPKVLYEFPPGSTDNDGIVFQDIQNYVIPKPQLCKKLLTFVYKDFRLISFPMYLKKPYYFRNMFFFNFVFVFKKNAKTIPYEPVIEKLGRMFQLLEEQSQILSTSSGDMVYFKNEDQTDEVKDIENSLTSLKNDNENSVYDKYKVIEEIINKDRNSLLDIGSIISKLYLDLNNYSECLIPINSANSLDIKLFTFLSQSTTVKSELAIEDVPFFTLNLGSVDMSRKLDWDQTLLKIIPYINGINSIYKISKLSNSSLNLVMEIMNNLVYVYKVCVICDIFQFENIYDITNNLDLVFLRSPSLLRKCQKFIVVDKWENSSDCYYPSKKIIFELYNLVNRSVNVRQFYTENFLKFAKNKIDIRKFYVFGCINGIIYRVMEFPILRDPTFLFGSNIHYNPELVSDNVDKLKKMLGKPDKGNQLLSTGDIKLTKQAQSGKKNNNDIKETLNDCVLKHEGLEYLANEIYMNVYMKKTANINANSANVNVNPRTLLLQSKKKSNNSVLTVDRERKSTSFSKRRSSLAGFSNTSSRSSAGESSEYDIQQQQTNTLQYESLSTIKNDLKLLINCLRNVDNLDRICVVLGKERSLVLEIIGVLGEYDLLAF